MKNKINKQTISVARTGMFTAIIAILSQISIPMASGVPVTLQTFAISLCGYFLGAKYGILSTLAYILLGAAGLPVFANFNGGFGVLIGVTGGFIWGFLFLTSFSGMSSYFNSKYMKIAFGLVGLIICHLFGVIQFSVLSSMNLREAFILVSLPYILKDLISVVAAYLFATVLNKKLIAAHML